MLDRPDLRIVDTREMPWAPLTGVQGGKVRMLAGDPGQPMARIVFLPAGADTLELMDGEGDHVFGLLLEGEVKLGGEGAPRIVKADWFVNASPGAPRCFAVAGSPTRAVMLQWRMRAPGGDDAEHPPSGAIGTHGGRATCRWTRCSRSRRAPTAPVSACSAPATASWRTWR